MENLDWTQIITLGVPFITIAGSAAAFVWKQFIDASDKRRKNFFELMQYIDGNAPIASKMAAVYELRNFPEHRDFIVRFCEKNRYNLTGGGADILRDELDQTRIFFERH